MSNCRAGASLPAIKKTWASIYRRVSDRLPELVSDMRQTDMGQAARGREKRREPLAYPRNHPREVRPFSRDSS